ncbi:MULTISPECIES: cbb3-type cytochrome oxidase assembly protein CcoS [unclassified Iodidimonas]|jgi:cbb3-type cytochrome oxidase maturation protein|uniref:cbb3-type cytochrome oxidase assembly protein CcoS n=1 Tax=unclassified Iodidimonas TaxID=2626145 RepID=UPI0024825FF2|nr:MULTISPECIES: cbb3-type cytochrome oxidase assembly protein CcoS [unclassified Iodidimonas]
MSVLLFLIPIALFLGGLGLAAFLWSLRSGQYDDLDGAAARILLDDDGPNSNRETDPETPPEAHSDEAPKKPDDSPC